MGEPASYAVVFRDNGAVHFQHSEAESANVGIFIWVKDVDTLHTEVIERGANSISPPTTQPYGIRDCVFEDINGLRITFGQDDELIPERSD